MPFVMLGVWLRPRRVWAVLAGALVLMSLALHGVTGLELTARCRVSADECPCSVREYPTPRFCLRAALAAPDGRELLCRQEVCARAYRCDCAGNMLCRKVRAGALGSAGRLRCLGSVSAAGECACQREGRGPGPLTGGGAERVVPIRPWILTRVGGRSGLCSEGVRFWGGGGAARSLLQRHWGDFVEADGALRVGAEGRQVRFGSAEAFGRAMPGSGAVRGLVGELRDPTEGQLGRLAAECLAAKVNLRLWQLGKPTRPRELVGQRSAAVGKGLRRVPVFEKCRWLGRDNPALGMDLDTFLQTVDRATGHWPLDDAGISHRHVVEACHAINMNYERCQHDYGCLAWYLR